MSVVAIASLLLLAGCMPAETPRTCLDDTELRALDAGWERAVLEGDADFLDGLLADRFVWVHDHASSIDSKESLLAWVVGNRTASTMRSREQSEVETRRLGSSAVVMGYTVVDREGGKTRYRFMRMYVETASGCQLLANQTMAIPQGG
jgi:hypothetical protein